MLVMLDICALSSELVFKARQLCLIVLVSLHRFSLLLPMYPLPLLHRQIMNVASGARLMAATCWNVI